MRFSDRAAIYAAARPSYPAAAIDVILSRELATPVIDMGTGTGIAARLMADRGVHVIGIDPGPEMLRIGEPHARVSRLEGKAEQIPIRSGATDLMTAFNAFHWFKPDPFFEEVRRVVRPGGQLALVWNDWDARDPFTERFVKVMRSAAGDHPVENRWSEVSPLFSTQAVANIKRLKFPYTHRLTRELLALRLKSMSYIPREGPLWDSLDQQLSKLFDEYAVDGFVDHHYNTHLFIADVKSV